MQKRTIFRWPFIKKAMNINTARQTKLSNQDIPSVRWYQNIVDLPLKNFIDCSVNGNIAALIISGLPSESDLINAWENIADQYAEAMGDAERKVYVKLLKEVAALECEYRLVQTLVDVLRIGYMQELADELNELLGINFDFNPDDQETYQKLLSRCINRSKAILIQSEIKSLQIEAMSKTANSGLIKPTVEFYRGMLITLSDHAGYQLTDEISTFDFCERMNRYTKYVNQVNSKKNAR
jgi:hypothetical protein